MPPRFETLRDWLDFCRLGDAPVSAEDWLDPARDEIREAVRTLTVVLARHEDAQRLANLWLTVYGGGRWRLVSNVGKRTRVP
jgi:hypothetical protein